VKKVYEGKKFNQNQKKEFFDSLLENLIEKETKGLSFDTAKEIQRDQNTLNILTGMESDVFKLYFGLGNQHAMTLEEIGERFDITRERVKQIKDKAVRHLEHNYRRKSLKKYLGPYDDREFEDALKVFEMMIKYGPDYRSKVSHEEEIDLDEAFRIRRKGEDIFKELIQDSLKNEKMCELKKEIGEKTYIEFLRKEMYKTLKMKKVYEGN
jgi:hypothetical protein